MPYKVLIDFKTCYIFGVANHPESSLLSSAYSEFRKLDQ